MPETKKIAKFEITGEKNCQTIARLVTTLRTTEEEVRDFWEIFKNFLSIVRGILRSAQNDCIGISVFLMINERIRLPT